MAEAKLARYARKRDFSKTAEPTGADKVVPSEALRFIIQKHAASHLHFDLRLEWDGVFKSWATPKGPSLDPHDRRLAMEVEDHPLAYGDFEGTIPKGEYGGGVVMLWDRGFWAPESGFENVGRALAKGELKFVMEGERVHGSWVLVRTRGDKTGRTLEEIASRSRNVWHSNRAEAAGTREKQQSKERAAANPRSAARKSTATRATKKTTSASTKKKRRR